MLPPVYHAVVAWRAGTTTFPGLRRAPERDSRKTTGTVQTTRISKNTFTKVSARNANDEALSRSCGVHQPVSAYTSHVRAGRSCTKLRDKYPLPPAPFARSGSLRAREQICAYLLHFGTTATPVHPFRHSACQSFAPVLRYSLLLDAPDTRSESQSIYTLARGAKITSEK